MQTEVQVSSYNCQQQ